ncbi:MAG: HDOD domain-containing protein [Candidatus Zixiibacteriota bacterium]|nr:MAG: HDOD domain-containing protein [candidate division Zixibacteria bacterium]
MSLTTETTAVPVSVTREEILQQLKGIRDLPTLPTVFAGILRALRNPNIPVKEVARVVEADQAISLKILQLINSSFYGLSRSVDSVHQAIVLLGAQTLKNVVISASVFKSLSGRESDEVFNRGLFWQHAMGCGMICRYLGNRLGVGRDEEGFIAGIIHDCGKVVLDRHFHDHLVRVVECVKRERISFYQAEQQELGISHTDIGAYLAETWSLPDKLVQVIARHHSFQPDLEHAELVALVQLSDMLARRYRVGSGGDDLVPALDPRVWGTLRLNPTDPEAWEEEIQGEIVKGKQLLNLMLT